MIKSSKCIIVSFPHHLDHLVPISYYEKIPLVVCNPKTQEALLEFYPWVPFTMMNQFEGLGKIDEIISTSTSETPIKGLHEALYQKAPLMVRYHHGYSDKVQDFSSYDKVLFYKDFPNHRLRFYHEFRDLMVKKAKLFLPKKRGQSPLLVTLTWDSPEHTKNLETLLKHPKKDLFLFRIHPIRAEKTLEHILLEAKHGLQLLSHECPYIYPFLEFAKGVLTDRTSIGYDALYFQKPLMVLDDVPLKKFSESSIDSWIEACLNSEKIVDHRYMYHQIFG